MNQKSLWEIIVKGFCFSFKGPRDD